jgi:hypothetical protein
MRNLEAQFYPDLEAETEWDFDKPSFRNKMQSEILEEQNLATSALRTEWMLDNGLKIRNITKSYPDFKDAIRRKDWQGAKKIIVERLV